MSAEKCQSAAAVGVKRCPKCKSYDGVQRVCNYCRKLKFQPICTRQVTCKKCWELNKNKRDYTVRG
jgi:hypothetical protein